MEFSQTAQARPKAVCVTSSGVKEGTNKVGELISWMAVIGLVAALFIAAAVGIRAYLHGKSPTELLFKPRPDPRLGIIEFAHVDGRRKLVLIRRDDVEHLIMTGGPVDVVIETGIGERKPQMPDLPSAGTAAPVFAHSPISFTAPSDSTSRI